MFVLLNGHNIVGFAPTANVLVEHISRAHTDALEKFDTQPAYVINSYNNAENYATLTVQNMKIIEVDSDVLLPASNTPYMQLMDYQGNMLVEGMTNVTDRYVRFEQSTYDGPQKVFATVTKRGLKSTGMTVIVDPNLVGRNVRTPEQYEELFGTFAKVKVTTNINANGWYGATLFLSADSLGDYRVETQQLHGRKTTFL